MMKRMLAVLMAAVMILGLIPVLAEEGGITVFVSVCQHGEPVQGVDGKIMAYLPVTVSQGGNLDDVFREMHAVYYPEGLEGYSSVFNEMYQSLSVEKMWGDTSGQVGYQVNHGTESVMGPEHPMEDGDLVDVAIYKNAYPDTEAYATFDVAKQECTVGDGISLTLTYVSGYDEFWNMVFAPCEGATIIVNGEETEIMTDAEGKATIPIGEEGTYIISAKKSKTLINEADPDAVPQMVPAITAPICVAEVKEDAGAEEDYALDVIHNIAAEYAQVNLEETAGNLSWILADMAVYESLFPNSDYCLSEAKKEEGMKLLVDFLSTATKPGDLAKGVIALRALGYDARNLYTENFEKVDAVAKLTALVDAKDEGVTNMYTLPYVIIALCQGEDYATYEQMEYLLNGAVATKNDWQSTIHPEYGYMGTDAMTPMILALAPFCEEHEQVASAVEEAVVNLKAEQREDGLIDGYEGYEPAATGLAICALSAMGEDGRTITSGGANLIEGLLSCTNENGNGFSNAFATEQGFRGLLAWKLLTEGAGKTVYDFADCQQNEANVGGAVNCPVVFEVSPGIATVTIDGQSAIKQNCFDLGVGVYTYTAQTSGFASASGIITISQEDVSAREPKRISITLIKIYGGMGGVPGGGTAIGGGTSVGGNATQQENNKTDEKEDKPAGAVMTSTTFPDVKEEDWYYNSVKYVYENGLFQGTEMGFEPNASMSRAMLVTVLYRFAAPDVAQLENPFTDVPEGQWYTDGIKWAAANGIVNGVSADSFDPDAGVTREQLALILYRYALFCDFETDAVALENFVDAEEISAYAVEAIQYAVAKGIISGKAEGVLAPKDGATRAEVATMLMRFANGVR